MKTLAGWRQQTVMLVYQPPLSPRDVAVIVGALVSMIRVMLAGSWVIGLKIVPTNKVTRLSDNNTFKLRLAMMTTSLQ